MNPQVLQEAIKGVNREIHRRCNALAQRKNWYLCPERATYQFTWTGFYDGFRIMREIQKLKIIRSELAQMK